MNQENREQVQNDEKKQKKEYMPPECTTHNPLEIMSKYRDSSSDLPFPGRL